MKSVLNRLIIGGLLIISCNSKNGSEKTNPDSVIISKPDTTDVKTVNELLKEPTDTGLNDDQRQAISDSIYYSIIQRAKIDILEIRYTNTIDTLRDGTDVISMCEGWKKLSKEDIIAIFKQSEPINAFEFHYMFLVYPCNLEGRAFVDNREVKFSINAAATSYLEFGDGAIRLGYLKRNYRKYFLEGADPEVQK
jgi:hypothetical protein